MICWFSILPADVLKSRVQIGNSLKAHIRIRVRSRVERFARSFVSIARPQVFLFERSSSVHLLVFAYVPTLFCAHLEDRQDSVSQPGSVIF